MARLVHGETGTWQGGHMVRRVHGKSGRFWQCLSMLLKCIRIVETEITVPLG